MNRTDLVTTFGYVINPILPQHYGFCAACDQCRWHDWYRKPGSLGLTACACSDCGDVPLNDAQRVQTMARYEREQQKVSA